MFGVNMKEFSVLNFCMFSSSFECNVALYVALGLKETSVNLKTVK